MEIQERIPLERLNAIANLSYSKFKELTPKCKNDKERKTYFQRFMNYIKHLAKAKGEITRCYAYTEQTPNFIGGRLFSGNSIQGISADIRGFLCNGYTTDIDMKNCHPKLLAYLCRKHSIDHPVLKDYINRRDEIISDMDNGKTQFLISTNTEKPIKTTNTFLKLYDKEMKSIHKQLLSESEYAPLFSIIPKDKLNWNGSAINRLLCVYENKCLEKIHQVITKRGIEIFSLMFDGIMVYGDYYNDPSLITEINDALKEYDMIVAYKCHSNVLQIEDMTSDEKEADDNMTQKEATKILYSAYPHWVYCENNLYVFDEDEGLWTTSDTIKNKIISKYAPIGFNSNLNSIKTLREFICIFCINNNWLKQKNSSGLGKILFNNGYYDGDTKKFHSVFNPEVVFFSKIHHDYKPFTEEDKVPLDNLVLKYFTNPLNLEAGAYYIDTLAKGLFGFRHKRFLMGLGVGDNGKSKLLEALSLACGDYIGVFNGENLAYSKSSADEASQNRWMMLLQHKRIVYSSEIKMDMVINGNGIKKMTGGDMISGRTHNKEETTFDFHPLPILCANDIPKITPYDKAVDARLRVCSYTKTYVVGATEPDELEKDPNLDAEIKSPEFQRLLIMLFIQRYTKVMMSEPDDVINAKKEWIDETADLIQNMMEDFTFTNIETDYVTSKELNDWAIEKKLGISSTKLGREINKYAEKKGLDIIKTIQKKIGGKNTACWGGIKSESETMM